MNFVGRLAIALTGCVVLGLTGCKASTGPIGAAPDEVTEYPTVTMSQATLRNAVAVQPPIVSKRADQLRTVTLPMRSESDQTLHVEWRILWYDDEGLPVLPAMTWRPMVLDPRQPKTISVTAMTVRATDYNIQMRWTRP